MCIRSNIVNVGFVAATLSVSVAVIGDAYAQDKIRTVVSTEKDSQNRILGVCNPSESWQYRTRKDVIEDIQSLNIRYQTLCETELLVSHGDIVVMSPMESGIYITTDGNETTCDNLKMLPDCSPP